MTCLHFCHTMPDIVRKNTPKKNPKGDCAEIYLMLFCKQLIKGCKVLIKGNDKEFSLRQLSAP